MRDVLVLDSLILVGLRGCFFFLARRYLLDSLNPTLRELSADDLLPQHGQGDDPDTDDVASPSSSYPASPAPRGDKTSLTSDRSEVELDVLNQRLREANGNARRRVLHLAHGHRSSTGKAAIQKTTRGLSRAARIMFSLVVTESCILLTLVMLHSIGILDSYSRRANFSASLHLLLGMILFIIPLEQCLLLTYRSRRNDDSTQSSISTIPLTTRLLISLIPFALYVFIFTRIPPYVTTIENQRSEESEDWEHGGWLASSLGRVIVLGTAILGALSGFGAVRTAWNFVEHLRGARWHPVTESDILQVERSLFSTRQEIVSKQRESPRPTVTWTSRIFGGGSQDDGELRGLQAIEQRAAKSLRALKKRKRQQEFGRSIQGQLYRFLGYAFALYCAARVSMCLPSLFWSTSLVPIDGESRGKGNTNGDWISFLLAIAIAQLPFTSLDVGVVARMISIILTGLLILSSLSQVMRSLTRVLHLTSKTIGSGFLLLSLGQLFATYIISLLVQLRNFIPTPTDTAAHFDVPINATAVEDVAAQYPETPLLSSLPDFKVFGRLFDITFLLAATFTAAYRYISSRLENEDFHHY